MRESNKRGGPGLNRDCFSLGKLGIAMTNMKTNIIKIKGFTLVELLVVIALLAIVLAMAGGSFSSILKGSAKAAVINNLKQNGNFAVGVIERLVRNSKEVQDFTNSCDTEANGGKQVTTIVFVNNDNTQTELSFEPVSGINRIVLTSGTPQYLTSDKVNLMAVGTKSYMTCYRDLEKPLKLTINFTLEPYYNLGAGVTPSQQDYATLDFQNTIAFRNY